MSASNRRSADVVGTALRRWFEELSDRGIFTTDTKLVVTTWNPWLETQTGLSPAEAIGRPLLDLYPSLAQRGLDRPYHSALAGEVVILSERLHKHLLPVSRAASSPNLTEMAQSVRIAPLTIEDAVVGTITVIEDVNARVTTERELRSQIAASEHARAVAEEASKLKDEFLTTLSHEIRTPLNAVLGWARILRTQRHVNSLEHGLEVIERNAEAQLRLVEDLLDMARVVSGKLHLNLRTVPFESVVRAAVDVVSPAAAAKQISIHVDFDPRRPAVNGDSDRLQQAVWNLLSNAVKFTATGGHIDVRITDDNGVVVLMIRDDGKGIARDFLPFVFDRFRQADASASRRHGGLGLGLALVREIAELHGGSVFAESEGDNRGSTFVLRLPMSGMVGRVEPRQSAAGTVALQGISVLLVDDDDDAREMLMTALNDCGARVEAVASGSHALELLGGTYQPDVIVSDIGMADVDGYELMRRVRLLDNTATRMVPAIAVTAYANADDRKRAEMAGYQAHLTKPVDPALVAASIAQVVAARPHQPAIS